MEPSWPAEPALVVEADDVDDELVAVPLADSIAVPGRILRLDRIVGTTVDRDDAEQVVIPIQHDQFGCRLDDLVWRTHARHAGGLAVERRIELDAFAIVVLHLCPELRLVHRLMRGALLHTGV